MRDQDDQDRAVAEHRGGEGHDAVVREDRPRQHEVERVRRAVGEQQQVARGSDVARPVEPLRVQEHERSRAGQHDPERGPRGHALAAEQHGRGQREHRDRRRQDRRVDRRRQEEPGDEEDLVERDAEQGVEEHPGPVGRRGSSPALATRRMPSSRSGGRDDAERGEEKRRDRAEGELAEDREERRSRPGRRPGRGGSPSGGARRGRSREGRAAAHDDAPAPVAPGRERAALGDVAEREAEADGPEARRDDGARHAAELVVRLFGVGERRPGWNGRRREAESDEPPVHAAVRPQARDDLLADVAALRRRDGGAAGRSRRGGSSRRRPCRSAGARLRRGGSRRSPGRPAIEPAAGEEPRRGLRAPRAGDEDARRSSRRRAAGAWLPAGRRELSARAVRRGPTSSNSSVASRSRPSGRRRTSEVRPHGLRGRATARAGAAGRRSARTRPKYRSFPFGVRPAAGRDWPVAEAAHVLRELTLQERDAIGPVDREDARLAVPVGERGPRRRVVRRAGRGPSEAITTRAAYFGMISARRRTFGASAASIVRMRVETRIESSIFPASTLPLRSPSLTTLPVLVEDLDPEADLAVARAAVVERGTPTRARSDRPGPSCGPCRCPRCWGSCGPRPADRALLVGPVEGRVARRGETGWSSRTGRPRPRRPRPPEGSLPAARRMLSSCQHLT